MTSHLTPAELGVDPDDYRLLLRTRELLSKPLPEGLVFDMSGFFNPHHHCGTACCIGGFMQVIGGGRLKEAEANTLRQPAFDFVRDEVPFASLFYPAIETEWNQLTPAEGVQAIDAFLSGNTEDPWAFARPA